MLLYSIARTQIDGECLDRDNGAGMNNRKNLITAIILQATSIIYGLIIPRLLISNFGSDTNGLVSSINQFLGFISLLEGGLGAVVLAELYKPIEEKNSTKILGILNSTKHFFGKLAVVFAVYTAALTIIYPLIVKTELGVVQTVILIIVLSFTTFSQYLFAITNKLFLQAKQDLYVVNIVTTIVTVLNLVATLVCLKIYPSIIFIKGVAAVIYLIQPIVYGRYVYIKYGISSIAVKSANAYELKNRWNGFAQNLAHFINMNTDIILITLIMTLSDVSIYSIYLLAITAIRSVIAAVSDSYQSALGKYGAMNKENLLKQKFDKFQTGIWLLSLILFMTCLLLINKFTALYTTGVNDANYYQPVFAIFIILANMIYSLREPYRLLILSAGKFKETNFGSVMEAVINMVISLALIKPFGLTGVAIGTLLAIGYRFIYFIYFLKKDVIYKKYYEYLPMMIVSAVIVAINTYIYFYVPMSIDTWMRFFVAGILITCVEAGGTLAVYFVINKVFNTLNKKQQSTK